MLGPIVNNAEPQVTFEGLPAASVEQPTGQAYVDYLGSLPPTDQAQYKLAASGPNSRPINPGEEDLLVGSGGGGWSRGVGRSNVTQPKPGSEGGPGSGKQFPDAIKDAARAESGNTCVFCGQPTTRTPGPSQSNIDHAVPKSQGGNNTLENAQNTCRTCNLLKGARTTWEFLLNLFR